MGVIRVLEAGMLTTVQDLGRPGWSSIGVPPGGAADARSARIGNRLVGARDDASMLEMTLVGATLLFEDGALIALCGAGVEATAREDSAPGRAIPRWRAVEIRAGETLRVGPAAWGARVYLCVERGLETSMILGGAGTHLAGAFGGHEGRALRAGDTLRFREAGRAPREPRALRDHTVERVESSLRRPALRATPGAQRDAFDAAAASAFWGATFIVSNRSDRAGVRLEGAAIAAPHGGRMPSEGMPEGAVQVPPGGEPIALLVDRPTTGGYPVIACVAGVDIPALAQRRPGDRVRFEETSVADARRAASEFDAWLDTEIPPA